MLAIGAVAFLLGLDPKSSVFALVAWAWAGFGAAFGPTIVLSLYFRGTRAGAHRRAHTPRSRAAEPHGRCPSFTKAGPGNISTAARLEPSRAGHRALDATRWVAASLRLRRIAGPAAAAAHGSAGAGQPRAEPRRPAPDPVGNGELRARVGDPRGRARGAAAGDHARLLPPGAADRGLAGEPRASGARHRPGWCRARGALDLVRHQDGLVRVPGARALGQ
ncbi:MAG: hypothetical protein JW751_03425 [Polyangiaceae bacterium]|nr:hypothetical protein [Polyangiaceae bacterium]